MKRDNESCHGHDHTPHSHHGITLHKHDGALVCSGEKDVIGELEAIKKKITNALKMLSAWVEEQGGIPGHIKAVIEESGPGYMLSTTGGEVENKEISRSNVHISLVAIVFNVEEEKLECRVASLVDTI